MILPVDITTDGDGTANGLHVRLLHEYLPRFFAKALHFLLGERLA